MRFNSMWGSNVSARTPYLRPNGQVPSKPACTLHPHQYAVWMNSHNSTDKSGVPPARATRLLDQVREQIR